MYSSYYLSKFLVYFHILAIQLLICKASSLNLTNEYLNHKCLTSEGKYKPGSVYEKNLNDLINDDISIYSFPSGFTNIGYGEAPDTVTIIIQCRGDSYWSKCRSCSATAFAGLQRRCPRNKGGIIWYDQCFLHVTNRYDRYSSTEINYKNVFSIHNPNNVRENTKSFNKRKTDLLNKLMLKAARPTEDGLDFLFYAAGEMRLGKKTLYAMVQCMKVFGAGGCKDCLEWSIGKVSKCCDGKQGARVLGTECNLRYELYPFLRT